MYQLSSSTVSANLGSAARWRIRARPSSMLNKIVSSSVSRYHVAAVTGWPFPPMVAMTAGFCLRSISRTASVSSLPAP